MEGKQAPAHHDETVTPSLTLEVDSAAYVAPKLSPFANVLSVTEEVAALVIDNG